MNGLHEHTTAICVSLKKKSAESKREVLVESLEPDQGFSPRNKLVSLLQVGVYISRRRFRVDYIAGTVRKKQHTTRYPQLPAKNANDSE